MKTIEQASKNSGIPERLIRAVIRQSGRENLSDIARHGVNGGFAGFTYYSVTVRFFRRNRAEITELVNRYAEDLGENPIDMVSGFGCLAGHARREDYGSDDQPTRERRHKLNEWSMSVARCLGGGRIREDDTQVANALAWFAAEEVARAMTDE